MKVPDMLAMVAGPTVEIATVLGEGAGVTAGAEASVVAPLVDCLEALAEVGREAGRGDDRLGGPSDDVVVPIEVGLRLTAGRGLGLVHGLSRQVDTHLPHRRGRDGGHA